MAASSVVLAEDANDHCQNRCMKKCAIAEPFLMKTQMSCRIHCVSNCIFAHEKSPAAKKKAAARAAIARDAGGYD